MSFFCILNFMWQPQQYIEIFHLIFIRHLEHKLDKNLYAIKGGCNLRFFYKSIRYSEDIDFDIRKITKETLQNKINKLFANPAFLQTLRSKGIEIVNISEPKQTHTTQRWKFSLRVLGLSMPLPTKIEFSRRDMDDGVIFEPIDADLIRTYQLYPVLANHYVAQAAFNQKVNALIHRSQTQARDIFDLKLLLDAGVDPKFLDSNLRKHIMNAIESALTIGFAEFKSQVVAYLMSEYQNYYASPKVWNNIHESIIRVLEELQV